MFSGAFVVATARTRTLSYVSQFGADHIINYNEKKWCDASETDHSNFDFVLATAREDAVFEYVKTEGLEKQGKV